MLVPKSVPRSDQLNTVTSNQPQPTTWQIIHRSSLTVNSLEQRKFMLQCLLLKQSKQMVLLVIPLRHWLPLVLTYAAKSAREPIWQAIWDLVKSLSEAMANPLPNFWKISKNFIEGKYRKVNRRMFYDRAIVHP
jgi:hypothetical protein